MRRNRRRHKRRPNPKVLFPIAVLAVGIPGAVALITSRPQVQIQPPEVPPPLVRVIHVKRQSLQLKVHAQGNVTPRTESTLISQVPGQVVAVSPAFASGGFFEAGDLLASIDPRDYELALARARSQVAQAEVRVAREGEEAALARQEWERVGQGEPTDLVLRKPQLAEAKAALEAAQANMEQARLNLERTQIRAPYAGRVRSKTVDVGQFVNPGAPLARIYSVDYAEVRLSVPNDQLAYLDYSLNFRNETQAGPETILRTTFAGRRYAWSGRIVRVEGEIDPRTRMVTLVARVENPYARGGDPDRLPLAVGLFVKAEILGRQVENIVVLPRSAIRGRDRVLVVDNENRLRFRTVDILRASVGEVVVRSGLDQGERVCTSPLDAVVDGMRVRIFTDNDDVASAAQGGAG